MLSIAPDAPFVSGITFLQAIFLPYGPLPFLYVLAGKRGGRDIAPFVIHTQYVQRVALDNIENPEREAVKRPGA